MSGPTLPRHTPDENEIGLFQIGASQIGDIPPFDIWTTIISQWANSPRLTGIIEMFAAALDQTLNAQNFFDLMWNIDTAVGYGLDVWGRILAVNRVLHVGVGPRYFGWDEGFPDYDPFNVSPFYAGEPLTQNYTLSDDGFRVLLIAKAYSNICDGSIPSMNKLLVMLFGTSGRCYVVDNEDMSFKYKFEFTPTPLQLAILLNSGVMPKPTGVSVTVETN
jgi:hypothetical protein